jgi:adenylate cyclase class 2
MLESLPDDMLEIEGKFKVESLDRVRVLLRACGARFLSEVLEENLVYDRPDGSLRASGCGLRVRRCRLLAGRPLSDSLTYKGPVQPGPLKKREEIDLHVSSGEAAGRVLAALGFLEVFRFEKRRQTWELNGCEVDLDELPYLGAYVEIEGPDPEAIGGVKEKLGLAECPHIREGYIALLKEHCRATGREAKAITFARS